MRVFVTGAAGFIGSRLSKTLIARGDQVIGFDNLIPAREERLGQSAPNKPRRPSDEYFH